MKNIIANTQTNRSVNNMVITFCRYDISLCNCLLHSHIWYTCKTVHMRIARQPHHVIIFTHVLTTVFNCSTLSTRSSDKTEFGILPFGGKDAGRGSTMEHLKRCCSTLAFSEFYKTSNLVSTI